jgi:hypothetical protein
MARAETKRDQFETRRRKEHVAFLVVKFLRAYVVFQSISEEFETSASAHCLEGCGLFEKVRELVNGHLFDLKERAHELFRSEKTAARGRRSGARASSETRSLDSYIGTGYHLLQVLQELLYQIERYSPELEKEKDGLSATMASDTEDLALRVMERCRALFGRTAEVIRGFVTASHDNEILILNLLLNSELVEKVFGAGNADSVFSSLCRGQDFHGESGTERALNYVREKCGNITALPAAHAGSGAA